MKKIFFAAATLFCICQLEAQVKEGTVIYERKLNMHRMIQDEQMRAMMPEFRTSKHMLLFSDSISIYKAVPEDEAPDPFAGAGGGGGVRMVFRGGTDGGDLYKNLSQAKTIQTSELGGKNFLITDSIQQQPWKMGTETKQVLGYTCHKASRKITQQAPRIRTVMMSGGSEPAKDTTTQAKQATKEIEVVAWYAENLISPTGPEVFGQLPGVILELNIDNGATVYTATEVKKTVDQKELKEPKKGKVVTKAEFQKMMMDMMNNQGTGGFRMSISQ